MTLPYCTIFVGTLLQESAISPGSGRGEGPFDEPVARDGMNRPTIYGTTLAGALIATARKLFDEIPDFICSEIPKKKGAGPVPESLWRVFTTHPETSSQMTEPRQGVGIRQDTNASAAGVLFDAETLPRDTCWWFCLEVDTSDETGGLQAEKMAAAALLEWTRGRCWIGRSVARGMGWMRLDDLKAYRLKRKYKDIWPDSFRLPREIIEGLGVDPVLQPDFDQEFGIAAELSKQTKRWYYVNVEGTISVGPRNDGYGLDGLSICGHAANPIFTPDEPHFLFPEGQKKIAFAATFAPDHNIVFTRRSNGRLEPFIPGSGLRGPIRHALSRSLRGEKRLIRDPNVDKKPKGVVPDIVEELFGTTEKSARLLLSDSYLLGKKWTAALLHSHAEDEFSAGTFGTSKYSRVILTDALFQWRMVIEAENKDLAQNCLNLLERVLPLAEAGHLPIGGTKWRGAGWPQWAVSSTTMHRAGDD